MQVLLVVNDTASSVTPARRERVLDRLAARHEVAVATTGRRGHATELARAAARSGVDCVAVLAGDGTLNEAANGLVGTGCALAPLPGGSTNVFARSVGLPRDPVRAAERVGLALERGRTARMSVGEVTAVDGDADGTADRGPDAAPGGGRVFLCHVGVGWDAVLVANVERRARLKRHATVPLYAWAGVRAFFHDYDRHRPRLRVRIGSGGEAACVPDARFVLVLASDPYTYAGRVPFHVVPSLGRHSALGVVTLSSMAAPTFLRAAAQAVVGGLRPGRHVRVDTDVRTATVAAIGDPIDYQVDGDHLGTATRLRFRHLPDALTIVDVPS